MLNVLPACCLYETTEVSLSLDIRTLMLDWLFSHSWLWQEAKGPGCGSRSANQTALADLAAEGLRLRSELQRAVNEERYSDAAEIRDRLKVVQEQSAAAENEAASVDRPERKYQLGQRVKHKHLDYDAVVCG